MWEENSNGIAKINCNWEDDGTNDENQYCSINRGSMVDYRRRVETKKICKWKKGE